MNDTKLLEVIYDILAQNDVDELARDEVLRRIDHIDYDDGTIVFDQGDNTNFTLKGVRL